MKHRFKPLIITVLIISSIIALAIAVFIYQTKFQLTDIISYTSPDEVYEVSFQMIGEPEWPFGATTARVKVIKKTNHKNKIINTFTAQVHDDGAVLRDINCRVEWADGSVIITLTGSEQEDAVYIVPLSD